MVKRRGFSLAEVLLALAVLGVILVMAVGVLHFSMQSGRRGDYSLRATVLAEMTLDGARLHPQATSGDYPAPLGDFHYRVITQPVEKGLVRLQVDVDGPAGATATLWTHCREHPRVLVLAVQNQQGWQLARAPEEGGRRTLLPSVGESASEVCVSADGKTVAFVTGHGLWTMPADGSQPPTHLDGVPGGATEPCFSPDGHLLAYTALSDEEKLPQVFVHDLGQGVSRQLSHATDVAVGCPNWSPDGSQIAVVMGGGAIGLMSSGGGAPRAILESAGWNTAPAFSPDGKQLAFMSNRDGNPEIYLAEVGSSQATRLTDDPAYDTRPRWSADGRRLAFQSDREGGRPQVWTMNPQGEDLRLLSRPEQEVKPVAECEPSFLPLRPTP